MQYSLYDFLGNVGVSLIIITYLLLQLGRMSSTTFKFSFLNAIGALLIIISLFYQFNLSAFIIEAFWLLISCMGLYKFFSKK